MTEAINHPVGHITEAILNYWAQSDLRDEEGLPGNIEPILSEICSSEVSVYRYGRALLATRIVALFRVDSQWVEKNLLPYFDWERSEEEARAVWKGFLNAPRLYRPLLERMQSDFLECANHYDALNEHARNYASALTLAALEPGDTFGIRDLKDATACLPAEGKAHAARMLYRSLESAGEKKREHWENRIAPYIRKVWPKSKQYQTEDLSEAFAIIAISADDSFPDALEVVWDWISGVRNADMIIKKIAETGIPSKYPELSIRLIDRVVHPYTIIFGKELRKVIEDIKDADPALAEDARLGRLAEDIRRREE